MSKQLRPKEVMATLGELWAGKCCPHENECACRKGHWCPEAKAGLDNFQQVYPMMHIAGCSFAYQHCCCRVLEEVDILATEYLKYVGLTELPVPLDIIHLFDSRRSIEIRDVPIKRYHGCTWFVDGEWVIHLNSNVPPEVRHFTAFHEGFHVICGSSGLAFRDADTNHMAVSERLADYFAASILMPKDIVRRLWPDLKDAGRMAKIFAVPEPVMKDWLVRLRLYQPVSTLV